MKEIFTEPKDPYAHRKVCFLAILNLISIAAYSGSANQADSLGTQNGRQTYAEFSVSAASAGRLPFWQYSNQWGTVPTRGPVASLRAGIASRKAFGRNAGTEKSGWAFLYGVEIVGNAGKVNQILLPQSYIGLSFKSLQLTVGRWKQFVGLGDSGLGTGSYMWSGNALPLPKIQIGFHEYTPLPFTRGFINFKGFYSDGVFEDNRPITSHLKLHNKSLFIRLGRPTGLIMLHGGFNHAVQWGGGSPYNTENGQMPSGFRSYLYAVSGFKPKGKVANASLFDNGNRVGNHIASLDFGMEINTKRYNILLYRQNLIEDGSLYYLNNIKDGLNGISLQMKERSQKGLFIQRIVAEFLYTKSQGGNKMEPGSHIRGNDDYFNNGQVRDGWSYHGTGIGTPFITPTKDNGWPSYADFFTNNNRVWVAHLGVQGKANEYLWKTKLSYSNNEGSYLQPLGGRISQFSGIVSIQKPVRWLGHSTISASVSGDVGKLFKNTAGMSVAIRKDGLFKKDKFRTSNAYPHDIGVL
jgi:hypothetical protein